MEGAPHLHRSLTEPESNDKDLELEIKVLRLHVHVLGVPPFSNHFGIIASAHRPITMRQGFDEAFAGLANEAPGRRIQIGPPESRSPVVPGLVGLDLVFSRRII